MAAKPTSRLSIFHFGKKAKAEKKKLPKQCELCNHKFGLFRKRCQCGKCKTVMCASCSSRKSEKEPRICARCKPKLVRDPGAAAAAAQRAVRRGARKSKRGEWFCAACGFENERYHAACFACGTLKPKPKTTSTTSTEDELEESSFDPEPSKLESEDEGKKSEETLDKKDRPSSWWCANCVFENQGTDVNCKICGADKPAFSYLYWACPGCTLANILSNQVCELCSRARPAIGPELQAAQEAACQADILLSRENLAQDSQTLDERMEAAKRYLKEKKEEEEKAKEAEKLRAESTSTETSTSTESTTTTTTESTTTETTEAPVKKKVKKTVRFGFGGDIPSNPKSSRLNFARSQTLAFKKNKKAPVKGGGGKKHAITLKSEWLEAEMNVNKMLTEWTELNKKATAIIEAEDAKEDAEGDESTTETDSSSSSSTTSTTSTTTTEPEESTGEGVLIMTTPPTETGTESTSSSASVTPASSLPGSSASSRRGSLVAIEAAGDAPEQQEVFATLQTHYKALDEEEKEKERQEALKEPTETSETEKEKETEEEGEGEAKSISIEEELLGYLEGAKDRLTTFASHSQAYMEGTITAFMYYYMIGKTFGDGLVPVVLPLLLRGLDGHPKRQEALRRYHNYAFKKTCARCSKIVYLPEQILAENRPWHRWCFKCQADECTVELTLKTFCPFKGKIYCAKHVPKPDPKSNIVY